MSRDPGEGPDEDGEPDDQRPDRDEDAESDAAESVDKDGEAVDSAAEDESAADSSAGAPADEMSEELDTAPAAEENADDADETADTGDTGEADEEDEEADGEDEESTDDGEEDEEADGEDEEPTDDGEETEEEEEAEAEPDSDTTPIDRKTGPAEDEEQPLTEHIEEMVKRVAVVLVIAGFVSLLAFPFGEEFINFLWYSVLPSDISKPHIYHPLELIITQLKAASLLGIVLALPIFVYQTYAFMRPGLYPHERRYYLAAVPTSLVLAFVGLLFGYFLILPAVMTYFMEYSRDVVDIAFALGETFTLMLILLGFLAVVFQIPLFIMLAIMMGLTTRTWLEDRRLIMWGVFLGIAFLFSPDPTGMAPFLIALTMIVLFEGTLLLLRWTGRGNG